MAGKTLENLLIDDNYKKVKPKKKINIVIILIFIFLIIICALCGFFVWKKFIKKQVASSKEMFISYAFENNFEDVYENDLYKEVFKRIVNDSFNMETSASFSTTIDIEGFEDFEFSKFGIDNSLLKRAADNRVFTESIIKYLGNDIFKLNTVSGDGNYAINSDQILTKYISGDSARMNNLIKEVTGLNVNLDIENSLISDLTESENLELSKKNIKDLIKKFKIILSNNTTENNYDQKEIIIESNDEQVETMSYSLKLSKKEVVDILNDFEDEIVDSNFSEKIITNTKSKGLSGNTDKASYTIDENADLENIIDRSTFLVDGEINEIQNEVVQEPEEDENSQITLERGTIEEENIERRNNGGIDETVIGFWEEGEDPAQQQQPQQDNNSNQNVVVIRDPEPGEIQNNNQNNNQTTNSTPIVINTNTTNDNTTNGVPIPIGLIESVEYTKTAGFKRSLGADIQIIQNPNLTTNREEIEKAQENRELIKEETAELFSSFADTLERNTEIVDNLIETNKKKQKKDYSFEYEMIKAFFFKTKLNIIENDYRELFDSLIEKVNDHEFNDITCTIYVAGDKTIKVIINDDGIGCVELNFIKINDDENKVNVILLKDRNNKTGKMFEIYKLDKETSCGYKIESSYITNGVINEKMSFEISTKGTALGNNQENDLTIQYIKDRDKYFKMDLKNNINFEEVTIPGLSERNALFLNTLSNEEYVAIVNAVKDKTMDVLAEKMSDLNLIDINTGNEFVNRIQEEVEEQRIEEERRIDKETAKAAVVNRISELMGEAIENGEEPTLSIISGLTIDGYDVTVSGSQDEVLVIINGYQFIINSNFEIFDV